MTSVTNKDIARFAAGEITDEVEIARVMEAIRIRPELEDLYFLLSDTDESAAGPELHRLPPMLARLWTWMPPMIIVLSARAEYCATIPACP